MLPHEERTMSTWYDQLREGDIELLRNEINTVMCHSDKYAAWQIVTLRQMAVVHGLDHFLDETLDRLTDLINKLNERDRQARAAMSVNTKTKLLRRLKEGRSLLIDQYRELFTPVDKCRLDEEAQRLYSVDGKLFLGWMNTGTTVGSVSLYTST